MKIFISHSSINAAYGNALVELFRGIGINENEIIFTSNVAYGIPIGQNIFRWLKSQMIERPFVIYLLSKEYYKSVACLNEMGAAWIIENEHAVIFTPTFDHNSREFQNGAIDPREIGFHISDQERITAFIDSLRDLFNISTRSVLINQKVQAFLAQIESIKNLEVKVENDIQIKEVRISDNNSDNKLQNSSIEANVNNDIKDLGVLKLLTDIKNDKLKDEDILLLHYVIDSARYKLGTGWQESYEVDNIKAWEEVNNLNETLSRNYATALRRYDIRKLLEVTQVTGGGNTKEVSFKQELNDILLELPIYLSNKISIVVEKNIQKASSW